MTAALFAERMEPHRSAEEAKKYKRYFKLETGEYGEGDVFMGVRMGQVFALAKEFLGMPISELELLLESPIHELRAGASSIMDKEGRANKTSTARRRELFDLYLRRIDRFNNWDLVDLAAPFVVGRYLAEGSRDLLDQLARSGDLWSRRTAILATFYFIRQGELDDTFRIAELLLHDPHDLIHKPVGGGLRWAGDKDSARLEAFLERHAATMPRTALRYAIEHFDQERRAYYLQLSKAN